MSVARAAVALLLASGVAHAAPQKLAITPLHDAPDLEKTLVELVQKLPSSSVELINVVGGKLQTPKLAPGVRLLTVELARLGEGRILYLQASNPNGSTTVAFAGESGGPSAADRERLRAGLVRVLAPEHFVGRLQVKFDVSNAEVQIDGKRVPGSSGTFDVAVGTHALRVTNPAYRDFLRFVDVEFDKTVPIDVALSAYPLAEGEMTEKLRKQVIPKRKLPWYRTWWALSLAGGVITGATIGLVYGLRPGVTADKTLSYQVAPSP